jgi:hypothetical protein
MLFRCIHNPERHLQITFSKIERTLFLLSVQSAAPTAKSFDTANLIKGKSFDFTDVMNLADQAGIAPQVFNQMTGVLSLQPVSVH